MVWSLVLPLADALLRTPVTGPVDLFAIAAALSLAVAVLLAGRAVGRPRATPARVPAVPARVRARRAEAIRQRDPGAAGRARPRAPSARPAVA